MTKINYTRHNDTRVNNPTMENRNFFVNEEKTPYVARYPRDPSLDPQLVWKGKDEQDREDLAVPTVPVYIQEKIQPAAIIEEVRKSTKGGRSEAEEQGILDFYGDFNGIESFDKEIEFYQHDKHWSNRMILGDSLLVMNSLAEKEGLKGKIQCIYIDPPYGIKFGSNWQVSTRTRDVKDGNIVDAAREPEVVRAFRDTWKLGIHSYLSYLRDRFVVARDLLTETGSVFVQIGDENVHLVRCVLDEVFGSGNFISQISFAKTTGTTTDVIPNTSDYLLLYAKDEAQIKFRSLFQDTTPGSSGALEYKRVELVDGSSTPLSKFRNNGKIELPGGARIFATDSIVSAGGDDPDIDLEWQGQKFRLSCKPNRHWKPGVAGIKQLWSVGRLLRQSGLRIYKRYFDDFPYREIISTWGDTRGDDDAVYVVQTHPKVVERCLVMTTDPGDLVLDPTCGSGTTAYVAEQWGRRWITIDTSRVALALARTRLMAARFPYYLLGDSSEGVKKEAELSGQVPPSYFTGGDVKKGFVYKRVPHVTLKSIANNPDIHEGMSREEIDRAIAKHADTEMLYDQPYEDNKRIRVTGPFTVESLSPHRVLPAEEERPTSEADAQRDDTANDFVAMVLDNLRKAGVQNTKKGEKLVFEDLQPFAGRWVNAKGTYKGSDGRDVRVAVSVGPEYGAVSPLQVKEAAKEAMQGLGHDVLVVCGYAFDPHVSEEAKQYGALTVLPTRMNADLLMADDLLKKTGAGNLFMVFGEPDVSVKTMDDGRLTVEVSGLDVYDPTTGEIRNSSTDDIACWFIDTNYNGESFFVRHAYFLGADEPYEKLKRALRAEVEEAAWASLYSNVSRPFPKPETGKIAVKVINHYGDEVLKVYEV